MLITDTDIRFAQLILFLEPTGKLDELTEAALRNYQLKNKLPVTGQLDPMTLQLMINSNIKIGEI